MKIVIDDVLTHFTSRIDSHRSAWPRMQACMLRDAGHEVELAFGDLDMVRNADVWVISHGMEFNGKYNLNGGWQQVHSDRLRVILEKGVDGVASLEREMPNLTEVCRPRAEQSDFDLTSEEWDRLEELCSKVTVIHHDEIVPVRRVVLGDSHSIARYTRGSLVLRNDGLTLHGLLKRGIRNVLHEAGVYTVEKLVIQAGNIDIRHHLMRQPDPIAAADELMAELWKQLEDLHSEGYVLDYEVTTPYPIEFEDRKLPKTGYYKGTPFYGSREDRVALAKHITNEMSVRFANVHFWPLRWYDMDPEEYASSFMEKPRSVHLSPAHHEWNYLTNERNR